MSLNTRIREQTAAYLEERISFEEFKEWFIPATWNVERDGDAETRAHALFITARLSEFMDGDISEQELRRHLYDQL